jgi:hypothetical protein
VTSETEYPQGSPFAITTRAAARLLAWNALYTSRVCVDAEVGSA